MIRAKNVALISAVIASVGTGITQAATTINNNFTVLDEFGNTQGGANDITFTWDGTLNTDPATAVSNATITSARPTNFFAITWTAYDVKIYGPGSYTLSTADTQGSAGCPHGLTLCASGGDYFVTVPTGAIMVQLKWAWGATDGIDVVNVWKPGSWTIFNPTNAIYAGDFNNGGGGGIYTGPTYDLVSTDWDGDGKAGAGMIDGPFPGYSANFSVNAVPIPGAIWLFGPGLLGLLSVARRKKKTT